ncbi:MAG: hypothetical protein HWD92_08850 [Flavobacteriia bacterium]|nr:hypothetical protein [Flavobacteriia bacterium]
MGPIRIGLKKGKSYEDAHGVTHSNAVIVPGVINHNLALRTISAQWFIYANESAVYSKAPLAVAFSQDFNAQKIPNHTDKDGNVLSYGKASYSEAISMFDFADNGIFIQDPEARDYLMRTSFIGNKPLTEDWEITK